MKKLKIENIKKRFVSEEYKWFYEQLEWAVIVNTLLLIFKNQ